MWTHYKMIWLQFNWQCGYFRNHLPYETHTHTHACTHYRRWKGSQRTHVHMLMWLFTKSLCACMCICLWLVQLSHADAHACAHVAPNTQACLCMYVCVHPATAYMTSRLQLPEGGEHCYHRGRRKPAVYLNGDHINSLVWFIIVVVYYVIYVALF